MGSYLIILAFAASWCATSYPYVEASPTLVEELEQLIMNDDGGSNLTSYPMVCVGNNGIKEIKFFDGTKWPKLETTDISLPENKETSNKMTFQNFHLHVPKCICF